MDFYYGISGSNHYDPNSQVFFLKNRLSKVVTYGNNTTTNGNNP